MKKRIRYEEVPLGKVRVVKDFLPSPEELAARNRHQKVTLNLNESSVTFFKKLAKKSHVPYQKVIRNLLDHYVSHAA